MATPNIQNFKQKNDAYASNFKHGDLPLPPVKKYLVLTCMDARINPFEAFGINIGDAHIIRNGGGSAREALRSILISEQLLETQEIVLVKHTDCGMLTFTNEEAHEVVSKKLGATSAAEISTMDFMPFSDPEQAVREDVDFLRKQSAIPKEIHISGWIYDVKTGRVRSVE